MEHSPLNARAVFDHAIEIESPAGREAYVAQACGDDTGLRRKVDALLQAYGEAGSFLESPAAAALAIGATVETAEQGVSPLREGPGSVIGPYKLLQQIGEGGMGVVFLAEQQRPVRRQVALKVIKAGMDTRQVVARFEAERQALALMDHVNIARVLDAGATESGRPYFVMELVKGVPITEYCDNNRLTPRERLELFGPVCQAVQHAHTKGIIHRDLKPSNVLVALYDDRPVPKVIDFGVSKAVGARLTDATLFTEFGSILGTVQYMSPEQAGLNQLDVDTRSDVYSLGVLLYELLTGTTPLEPARVKSAALLEALRLVREEESPRPSTRLSTAGQLASVSASRQTEPAKLAKLVRDELDWIVMKTLEKDRNQRYESASAFARDIAHYLNDEPVQACPPSARYRLRKLMRRNKASLITGGLVALSLLVGTVVSVWQAVRAVHAEQRAEAKQKLAEEDFQKARDAVNEYFTLVSQNKLLNMPGLELLRRDLLEAALRYYGGMLDRHEDNPAVMADIAATHLRVSTIYHYLDRNDDALAAIDKALPMVERLLHDHPGSRENRRQLAGVFKFGTSHGKTALPTDPAAALRTLLKAIELWTALAKESPTDEGFQSDLASLHWLLGSLEGGLAFAHKTADYGQALEHLQKAAPVLQTLSAAHPENSNYLLLAITAQGDLAWHLKQAGNQPKAQQAYARKQELQSVLLTRFSDELPIKAMRASQMLQEGFELFSKDPKKAEALCRQAQQTFESLVTAFPMVAEYQIELARSYRGLHEALWYQNSRIEEQIRYARRAIAIYDRLLADFPERRQSLLQAQAHNHAYLGFRLDKSKEYDAARAAFEASSEVFRQCAENTTRRERATCLTGRAGNSVNIASLWEAEGRGDESKAALREALARYELLLTEGLEKEITPGWINGFHGQLAQVLERVGTPEDALRISGKLHPLGPEFNSQGLGGLGRCHLRIARVLLNAGRTSEAEAALQRAREVIQQIKLRTEPGDGSTPAAAQLQEDLDKVNAELEAKKAAPLKP